MALFKQQAKLHFMKKLGLPPSKKQDPPPTRIQKQQDQFLDARLDGTIQDHIFPHWRSHSSLKGFCAINYPSTKQNPLLMHKRSSTADLKTLYLKDRTGGSGTNKHKHFASAGQLLEKQSGGTR